MIYLKCPPRRHIVFYCNELNEFVKSQIRIQMWKTARTTASTHTRAHSHNRGRRRIAAARTHAHMQHEFRTCSAGPTVTAPAVKCRCQIVTARLFFCSSVHTSVAKWLANRPLKTQWNWHSNKMEKLTRFGWQLNQTNRIVGLNRLYCAFGARQRDRTHHRTTFEWPKTVSNCNVD